MTSIIGYTRVPFNSSASKNLSIAPVQQLCQNKAPRQNHQQNQQQQQLCIAKSDSHDSSSNSSCNSSSCSNNTRRPTYHRMFSREMNHYGIIELIIDQKKQKENSIITTNNKHNNNRPSQDNKRVAVNKENTSPAARRPSFQHTDSTNYNILLSIDLSSTHDYDILSSSLTTDDNLQKLMDAISRIAQEKTIHFVHILNLLKKLQSQQEKHRFMGCIDRHGGKILVYFPNTISYTSVDQTYEWLKYTIDIDIDRFKHWQLSTVDEQQVHSTELTKDPTKFDGENYFNDIHLFIDHIDALIESDGLFSHHKNKKKKENQ